MRAALLCRRCALVMKYPRCERKTRGRGVESAGVCGILEVYTCRAKYDGSVDSGGRQAPDPAQCAPRHRHGGSFRSGSAHVPEMERPSMHNSDLRALTLNCANNFRRWRPKWTKRESEAAGPDSVSAIFPESFLELHCYACPGEGYTEQSMFLPLVRRARRK